MEVVSNVYILGVGLFGMVGVCLVKIMKERRCVHHSNFVILKNMKGGLKNEKIIKEKD